MLVLNIAGAPLDHRLGNAIERQRITGCPRVGLSFLGQRRTYRDHRVLQATKFPDEVSSELGQILATNDHMRSGNAVAPTRTANTSIEKSSAGGRVVNREGLSTEPLTRASAEADDMILLGVIHRNQHQFRRGTTENALVST
jgi:hypothetical protein